jgi:uncharacterized delta-60 repeat protein
MRRERLSALLQHLRHPIAIVSLLPQEAAGFLAEAVHEDQHRDKCELFGPGGNTSSDSDFIVARLNNDGALDVSFDQDSKLTIPTDRLSELALLPDGKLVALGYHKSPDGDTKFVLYRLHPNGALDTSFDFDGAAAYDFGGLDNSTALSLQPDGRILAASSNGTSAVLIRLWPSGTTPDTGGQQTHGLQAGRNELTSALAVQSDGKLLVAGQANAAGSLSSALVSRFLADGQIDGNFGFAGTAHRHFSRCCARFYKRLVSISRCHRQCLPPS